MNSFNNVIFGQKAFLVNDKKQILVLKRNEADVFSGYWDLPGGRLEAAETLQAGLVRQIKEETGMNLERVVLQLTTTKFAGDITESTVIFRNIYLCTASGQVKLSPEHSEYRWVETHELADLPFPPDPDYQAALLKVAEVMPGLDLGRKYSLVF